jgi:flavin-dependent thymidylate synthase
MSDILFKVNVLDHGYVICHRIDGTDLDVELAARTSFAKNVSKVTPGFIERLAKEKHMSPFRHVGLWFEIKFPGDVRGQFLKHIVGNCVVEEGTAWNEQSNRGSRDKISFHYPLPRSTKGRWGQGELIDKYKAQVDFESDLHKFYSMGEKLYNKWLQSGVAAENARKFLPFYGMYTTVRCRMSLEAAYHFWELRQSNHAQLEIQEYSKAIDIICSKYFPIAWSALKANVNE